MTSTTSVLNFAIFIPLEITLKYSVKYYKWIINETSNKRSDTICFPGSAACFQKHRFCFSLRCFTSGAIIDRDSFDLDREPFGSGINISCFSLVWIANVLLFLNFIHITEPQAYWKNVYTKLVGYVISYIPFATIMAWMNKILIGLGIGIVIIGLIYINWEKSRKGTSRYRKRSTRQGRNSSLSLFLPQRLRLAIWAYATNSRLNRPLVRSEKWRTLEKPIFFSDLEHPAKLEHIEYWKDGLLVRLMRKDLRELEKRAANQEQIFDQIEEKIGNVVEIAERRKEAQ